MRARVSGQRRRHFGDGGVGFQREGVVACGREVGIGGAEQIPKPVFIAFETRHTRRVMAVLLQMDLVRGDGDRRPARLGCARRHAQADSSPVGEPIDVVISVLVVDGVCPEAQAIIAVTAVDRAAVDHVQGDFNPIPPAVEKLKGVQSQVAQRYPCGGQLRAGDVVKTFLAQRDLSPRLIGAGAVNGLCGDRRGAPVLRDCTVEQRSRPQIGKERVGEGRHRMLPTMKTDLHAQAAVNRKLVGDRVDLHRVEAKLRHLLTAPVVRCGQRGWGGRVACVRGVDGGVRARAQPIGDGPQRICVHCSGLSRCRHHRSGQRDRLHLAGQDMERGGRARRQRDHLPHPWQHWRARRRSRSQAIHSNGDIALTLDHRLTQGRRRQG